MRTRFGKALSTRYKIKDLSLLDDVGVVEHVAAQRGYIDDIIDPATTRARIIKALGILQNKRDTNPMKKHGNIPL